MELSVASCWHQVAAWIQDIFFIFVAAKNHKMPKTQKTSSFWKSQITSESGQISDKSPNLVTLGRGLYYKTFYGCNLQIFVS